MGRIAVDISHYNDTVWAPGRYRLSIWKVEEQSSVNGRRMLRVSFHQTGEVFDEQGNVIVNPAPLTAYVIIDPVLWGGRKISFLQPFLEAAGLPWGDFDPEDLFSRVVTADVEIETYNGRRQNKIIRHVKT